MKENGCYDVEISARRTIANCKISLSLLQMPAFEKHIGERPLFENVPLSSLSELFIVKIENDKGECKKQLIKIPMKDIPETRDDEIFRGIVDTKEKFYSYISFMLCDDPEEFVFELEQAERALRGAKSDSANVKMPTRIYEQMLQIASRNPEQLRMLEDVTRIVKDKDYSAGFNKLYEQFSPLIPKLKKLL